LYTEDIPVIRVSNIHFSAHKRPNFLRTIRTNLQQFKELHP